MEAPQGHSRIMAAAVSAPSARVFAAHSRGVAVPEALSVVGFDDIPLSSATFPGLTTVRMPIADMVAAPVEIAIAGTPHEDRERTAVFTPQLIVRGSTGATPAPNTRG